MRNLTTTVVFSWFQKVWNQSDRDAIDQLLAKDVVVNGLGEEPIKDIEGFKQFYDIFRSQLKDISVNVEDDIQQDDIESALCTVKAIDIASNKNVNFSGLCLVKIVDNKIAEAWNHFDFLTMYQQKGYKLVLQ
jgi:predicted ester cyclase